MPDWKPACGGVAIPAGEWRRSSQMNKGIRRQATRAILHALVAMEGRSGAIRERRKRKVGARAAGRHRKRRSGPGLGMRPVFRGRSDFDAGAAYRGIPLKYSMVSASAGPNSAWYTSPNVGEA